MQCKQYKDFMKEYQYYRTFLWKYRKNGYAFKDHYFHPNMKIYENKVNLDRNKIEWRRVDEVYKAPLFDPNLINIDYIKQGTLGDCYFISGLLRIAKQPQLVSKLFDHTADTILGRVKNSINIKCGAVVVFFHAFGQETPVLIDTRLPFYKGTSTLVFSHPPNTHVSPWFCLVEKAYAKLFGSYSNIWGGNFMDSIYSLFGYQPLYKEMSSLVAEQKSTKKTPFTRILEYQKQGGVMSVGINENKIHKSSQELKAVGLISNHSYLLLKVIDYKGMHFFHLRNPWGKYEWKGDWSDNSPLWTKEFREALKLKKSDDGAFWMIEKDFIKYFTSLDISRPIPSDWHSKTFTMEMWPGDSDGCDPESSQAQIDKRPNYAIKIKQKVPSNQKVDLFFLIERRSYFPDKVALVKHKPSKYIVLFVLSNGKKLSQTVLKFSSRFYLSCSQSISYHKYRLPSPKDILTVALQRTEKSPVFEECSIRVACKYEFDLYDIDKPKVLVESNSSNGRVFNSITTVHRMVKPKSRKNDKKIKKYFKNYYKNSSSENDKKSSRNKHKSKSDDNDVVARDIKERDLKKKRRKASSDDDDDDDYDYENIFDDDDDDDDESSSSEDENDSECKDDELNEEKSKIEREVNEAADKQQKLLDEINQLEDQVDHEDDEKKIALLNKKIDQKRNKLEELEDKINALLNENDENEKTIHKMKNKKAKKPEEEKSKPKNKKSDDDDEKPKQKQKKSDDDDEKPKKKQKKSDDDDEKSKSKPQKPDEQKSKKKSIPKPKVTPC